MEARYRSTLWACCFANFFQAVGSCFAILYVPLRGLYGLSFTDFGILVSLNFITQVASDVLFSKPVEKYGFRPFAVAAPLVSAAGLGLFAAAPYCSPGGPLRAFARAGFCSPRRAACRSCCSAPFWTRCPSRRSARPAA